MKPALQRILVIRRDNIGDLACTTPMLSLLRKQYPQAWIGALVTRYNADVLAGNPDLDEVFSYQKAKHRAPGESRLGLYWARARLLWRLRRMRLDCVILPTSGAQPSALRLARWLAPRQIVMAGPPREARRHEVERCADTLAALGIDAPPPAMKVVSEPTARAAIATQVRKLADNATPVVGIHISARKPDQRWPEDHFANLMARLHSTHRAAFVLLWSPGAADNPLHPGDDEKAARLLALTPDLPVLPCPTRDLKQLIAALDVCDSLVMSDGGAMHLAAALGKPIVSFFGSTEPAIWRPWRVPHRVLRSDSRQVSDISPQETAQAWEELMAGGGKPE